MLPDADESHFPPTLRSSSVDLPRWSLIVDRGAIDDRFLCLSRPLSFPLSHLFPFHHHRLSHRRLSLYLLPSYLLVPTSTLRDSLSFYGVGSKGWPWFIGQILRSVEWGKAFPCSRMPHSLFVDQHLPLWTLHLGDLWKKLYIRHLIAGAWLLLSTT